MFRLARRTRSREARLRHYHATAEGLACHSSPRPEKIRLTSIFAASTHFTAAKTQAEYIFNSMALA
jgi:hypothetical protein